MEEGSGCNLAKIAGAAAAIASMEGGADPPYGGIDKAERAGAAILARESSDRGRSALELDRIHDGEIGEIPGSGPRPIAKRANRRDDALAFSALEELARLPQEA